MEEAFSTLPVRRIEKAARAPINRHRWPATLAPIRQILNSGLDFGPATIFVGENGAGKSTVVEALAAAFGLNPEGGTHAAMHQTRRTESDLADHLQVIRSPGASKRGVFLRAETMHGPFSYLETLGLGGLHEQSHGESFIDFVNARSSISGLWIFDEAEAALSLSGCLTLLSLLRQLTSNGSQVVLSTHSPILAALPGAELIEVGGWGYVDLPMRTSPWFKTGEPSLMHPNAIYATSTEPQSMRSQELIQDSGMLQSCSHYRTITWARILTAITSIPTRSHSPKTRSLVLASLSTNRSSIRRNIHAKPAKSLPLSGRNRLAAVMTIANTSTDMYTPLFCSTLDCLATEPVPSTGQAAATCEQQCSNLSASKYGQ